ncbi:hypothetical protein B5X24_HaOG214898 [Helicoverpa armigera]|uniref:Corticotropin-releasing factor domain-containing protein n=1 Tax=Helicoverpa armigera TaxID=29058 RepID=A0A2W1B1G9_HELAM|nr:hypothetical protein B5X24_HaOG214898 [Helicoverpa armigera]
MKSFHLLFVFLIVVCELPSKSDTRHALPRRIKSPRVYLSYRDAPLEMRERNERKQHFDNTNFRKHSRHNIPIIIITKRHPDIKINQQLDNLFGANSIMYDTISNMARDSGSKRNNYLNTGRRSSDLRKKYRRKLMAMMNKELNRQLLAKANALESLKPAVMAWTYDAEEGGR